MKQNLWRWARANVVATTGLAILLISLSGELGWIAGWFYVAAYVVYVFATAVAVSTCGHADLLHERATLGTATVGWDRWMAPISAVVFPALAIVVAALDRRLSLSPTSPELQLTAFVGLTVGYGLLLAAMANNRFFTAGVRLQPERGQTTVSSGPYALVRHPGYAGLILLFLATPLALGSGAALVPSAAAIMLTVARAALEDRLLWRELPGYQQYAAIVRYRLAPGIW